MKHSDFTIGQHFMCGGTEWKVTDIGTRTVIAINVVDGWIKGPPFALDEIVFDENDLPVCEVKET